MNLKFLPVILALFATPSFAQDAPAEAPKPAATAPAPVPPPTKWLLEMDQGDIQTLNKCVGEMTYREADPFVKKLQSHLKAVQP